MNLYDIYDAAVDNLKNNLTIDDASKLNLSSYFEDYALNAMDVHIDENQVATLVSAYHQDNFCDYDSYFKKIKQPLMQVTLESR